MSRDKQTKKKHPPSTDVRVAPIIAEQTDKLVRFANYLQNGVSRGYCFCGRHGLNLSPTGGFCVSPLVEPAGQINQQFAFSFFRSWCMKYAASPRARYAPLFGVTCAGKGGEVLSVISLYGNFSFNTRGVPTFKPRRAALTPRPPLCRGGFVNSIIAQYSTRPNPETKARAWFCGMLEACMLTGCCGL